MKDEAGERLAVPEVKDRHRNRKKVMMGKAQKSTLSRKMSEGQARRKKKQFLTMFQNHQQPGKAGLVNEGYECGSGERETG